MATFITHLPTYSIHRRGSNAPKFSHPVLAYVPSIARNEIRFLNPTNQSLLHRVEFGAQVTKILAALTPIYTTRQTKNRAQSPGAELKDGTKETNSKESSGPHLDHQNDTLEDETVASRTHTSEENGVLMVAGHRHIRLFDLYDFSWLITLAVAPSAGSPCCTVFDRYLWYESHKSPAQLVCFDWQRLCVVRRLFVDFDASLSEMSVSRSETTTGEHNPRKTTWLDCGSASPRETTEDECDGYDSGSDDTDRDVRVELPASHVRKSSFGLIKVTSNYMALTDIKFENIDLYRLSVSGDEGSHTDSPTASSIRIRLIAGFPLESPQTNPISYFTATRWRRADTTGSDLALHSNEIDGSILISVSVKLHRLSHFPLSSQECLALVTSIAAIFRDQDTALHQTCRQFTWDRYPSR